MRCTGIASLEKASTASTSKFSGASRSRLRRASPSAVSMRAPLSPRKVNSLRAMPPAGQPQRAEQRGDRANIDEAQRGQRRRRDEANAELEVAGEDERRGQGDEQAAEGAARRDREIESGETARRRSGAIQLAM